MKKVKSIGSTMQISVWNPVWNSLESSVRNIVRMSVGAKVRDSVWSSVLNSVQETSIEFYVSESSVELVNEND